MGEGFLISEYEQVASEIRVLSEKCDEETTKLMNQHFNIEARTQYLAHVSEKVDGYQLKVEENDLKLRDLSAEVFERRLANATLQREKINKYHKLQQAKLDAGIANNKTLMRHYCELLDEEKELNGSS